MNIERIKIFDLKIDLAKEQEFRPSHAAAVHTAAEQRSIRGAAKLIEIR